VFNALSPEEEEGLQCYYDEEYAPANLNAVHIQGDRPGSSDNLTAGRYDQLFTTLMPHIHSHDEILDVGCAVGGLLDYLHAKGFNRLSGCDMSHTYVNRARMKGYYRIELGNAEALPFDQHSYDAIVMEQVLEHLINPSKAFHEVKRVLKPNGIFCIGVPDASRYSDFYYFDYYWLLLREHIQHFDIEHLELLARQHGFSILDYRQTSHAVMSDQMIMPNLYAIFRSIESPQVDRRLSHDDIFGLRQKMAYYVDKEKLRQLMRSGRIAELAKSRRPLYVWGIGREFLYLHEAAGLKYCNIEGFIDMNPLKQRAALINGAKVNDSKALQKSSVDSILLISAVAHTDSIIQTAKSMGFKGEFMTFDKP
jgi:SAM-dependent methyltransferase